jgi:phosphoribosylamine--glycine ligase
MRVFLIGGGGREHALAWRLAQSPDCEKLYCAPGNAGIAESAEIVDIAANDFAALVEFAERSKIDLVVIGPEAPAVAGLVDRLRARNIAVFGPTAAAAQLEGSKSFMKELCSNHSVPTAAYGVFTDIAAATEFVQQNYVPVVIKADGLAAGKGVVIANTHEDAIAAVRDMLAGNAFGAAGARVVIEEFLDGEELSFFALSDGETVIPFASAQDHKRAFDGDRGPNTGGMGAYSPAHMISDVLTEKVMARVIRPVVAGMKEAGCPFTGVLYAGIMLVGGEPYVLEFNVRFGDPECQPLMMRFTGNLPRLLEACATGKLAEAGPFIEWSPEAALCVVMAAEGYPGTYRKGSTISGIGKANRLPGIKVFHAATAEMAANGEHSTCAYKAMGGRVLGVTALAPTIARAQKQAYEAVDLIDWEDGFCRRDIGWRAVR